MTITSYSTIIEEVLARQKRNALLAEETGFIETSVGQRHYQRQPIRDRFESVLEHDFWHEVLTHRTGKFEDYDCQFRVGIYRLDAAFKINGRWIGVELDGAQFHNSTKDAIRDREILSTGKIHEIIRIPYAAMTYYPHATMGALGDWHDEFKTVYVRDCSTVLDWGSVNDRIRCFTEEIKDANDCEHRLYIQGSIDEICIGNAFQTWISFESHAIVGTPESIFQGWNIKPITRRFE
jgi:hypothetical protein